MAIMRIWLDTEFLENGRTIELISIGMVREDGANLYAETPHAGAVARANDWLKANVLPHLRGGEFVRPRDVIARDIVEFAGPNPEFWAYVAAYDWLALRQLYGRLIDGPDGWPMYCRDLRQAIDLAGRGKPPKQQNGEHDALADALWTRDAWHWLKDRTNGGIGLLVPNTSLAASAGGPALSVGER